MFQSFDATTRPDQGPPRLAALRAHIADQGLTGFLVPRADRHQGEYVAPCDERLAWLTGFTGSAGFAAVLPDIAAVFVDGRYRLQVRAQTASEFTPVNWPEVQLGDWLADTAPQGAVIGFDPWLHGASEIETLTQKLTAAQMTLRPVSNAIDAIWQDRPAPPAGKVTAFPKEIAGKGDETKRAEIAAAIVAMGCRAAILTLPDSICWLLNIRGSDIVRNPITQAFAVLHSDGRVDLYSDPAKFDNLGPDPAITLHHWDAFEPGLRALADISEAVQILVDKATAPYAISQILGDRVRYGRDPCALPKACKTPAEIQATRVAHLRDGAAMCEFLAWFDAEAPKGQLTEIDVVEQLESYRRATNALLDISFETICGAGPNGAIMHYRVTRDTNRQITPNTIMVLDSGGQYQDGTTDITRTLAIGQPTDEQRHCFTRVLQGMIAISLARWPRGLAGRDLDPLARQALWRAGQDFDHGTGHGVGVYLCVHEGPQRLAKRGEVPLEPGMILSNEPGYYRDGAFGIRIENLVVVEPATPLGDNRDMLSFETITWVPIDRRLIDADMLTPQERTWLNGYHAEVAAKIGPKLSPAAQDWLHQATAPV